VDSDILNAIDEEIERLREARALLAESMVLTHKGSSRRTAAKSPSLGKRVLSPEARRAIAEGQRKRWAKVHNEKNGTPAKKEATAE
jgi:hypothetical protein